jgi:hypothetical protein
MDEDETITAEELQESEYGEEMGDDGAYCTVWNINYQVSTASLSF